MSLRGPLSCGPLRGRCGRARGSISAVRARRLCVTPRWIDRVDWVGWPVAAGWTMLPSRFFTCLPIWWRISIALGGFFWSSWIKAELEIRLARDPPSEWKWKPDGIPQRIFWGLGKFIWIAGRWFGILLRLSPGFWDVIIVIYIYFFFWRLFWDFPGFSRIF